VVRRKLALLPIAVVSLLIIVDFSATSSNNQSLVFACKEGGVVEKAPCQNFSITVTFKNTGKTEGTWSINVAFEGEKWTWSGIPQTLTLKPTKMKTLAWNGNVPCNAPIDSVARLIVYYNDSFTPLNWWIHVVSGAELTVASSTVE